MQIGVITNPNSRKNKARPNRAQVLQDIVGKWGEVHETESIDSIKPILREFLEKRAQFWVADGGDGALHWMLRVAMEVLEERGMLGEEVVLPMTLLPTRGGTIDFIANNVGIESNAESLLADLRSSLENGNKIEETVVDSMRIEGVQLDEDGNEIPFRTYGFAVAAAGVGQRFFDKYYEDDDPNPKTIMKVVANTVASMPVSLGPLKSMPGISKSFRSYAKEMFEPHDCQVSIDGMVLEQKAFTGIHIASMSINLGGVFRLFQKADKPGQMHAIIGAPSPLTIVRNLPRMTMGRELRGDNLVDRECREMTIEAKGQLLAPIVDGEAYKRVKSMKFTLGPSIRIPKLS